MSDSMEIRPEMALGIFFLLALGGALLLDLTPMKFTGGFLLVSCSAFILAAGIRGRR